MEISPSKTKKKYHNIAQNKDEYLPNEEMKQKQGNLSRISLFSVY
jgi:hypothetical protein